MAARCTDYLPKFVRLGTSEVVGRTHHLGRLEREDKQGMPELEVELEECGNWEH